jgi:hypothetical protein
MTKQERNELRSKIRRAIKERYGMHTLEDDYPIELQVKKKFLYEELMEILRKIGGCEKIHVDHCDSVDDIMANNF